MLTIIFLAALAYISVEVFPTPEMGLIGIIPLIGGMATCAVAETKQENIWLYITGGFQTIGGIILLAPVMGYYHTLLVPAFMIAALFAEPISFIEWCRSKDADPPAPEVFRDKKDSRKNG